MDMTKEQLDQFKKLQAMVKTENIKNIDLKKDIFQRIFDGQIKASEISELILLSGKDSLGFGGSVDGQGFSINFRETQGTKS